MSGLDTLSDLSNPVQHLRREVGLAFPLSVLHVVPRMHGRCEAVVLHLHHSWHAPCGVGASWLFQSPVTGVHYSMCCFVSFMTFLQGTCRLLVL